MPGTRLNFSKLYPFSCFKSQLPEEYGRIGQRGYSRVVHCNDPDNTEAILLNYKDNYISTTKYNAKNFIPKSLFEQFRRVANFYYLIVVVVSFSPLAPYRAVSVLMPLLVVIGATMAKEGIEDWKRRKQDVEVNNRKILLYGNNYSFEESIWENLRVGDVVQVCKDEYFPADLLLLSSSYEAGVCYVETMNLDGETNLKLKHALDATTELRNEESLKDFKAVLKCEDPNDNLYMFIGTVNYGGEAYPLSMQQVLLRDSKLKNTDYIYGVVIFAGHDTKVMQNAVDPPSKRSNIERRMDRVIYVLFCILILMSSSGSMFLGIETRKDIEGGHIKRWYLQPGETTVLYDPKNAPLAAILHFFTGLMLYGYLIPISLYISIEIVKVLQSIFINQDQKMYYYEMDKPARARTSNLNEELGQVDTILSDKTGTLTSNLMEFVRCSIGGISYGSGLTEVERTLARKSSSTSLQVNNNSSDLQDATISRKSVKGFNFHDERILYGQWVKEPNADIIEMFFRVLAVCNTAVPVVIKKSDEAFYEAESPDEAAFVVAAREVSFELLERTQTSVFTSELDPSSGKKVKRAYDILQVLEFSSSRKRMSVIVRNKDNRILLLTKGADSVMFERISKDGRVSEHETKEHITTFAEAGLRTLVIAFRELREDEYKVWEDELVQAKTAVTAEREAIMEAIADRIERNLLLLGATAVEDKLQEGVPECINKLSQAGIKLWVLTGDKMETAVNIGYACNLLRSGMTHIDINLESPDIQALEKRADKDGFWEASFDIVMKQLNDGLSLIHASKGSSTKFSLVIDGKSLNFALTKQLEKSFLELALGCAAVICCRSTPKHKALVARLLKTTIRKTTLAIGDGANDVGMLQEADIGVGISGVEGMQAVMASDYAIAQFRFLERLLLVHGHWCYRRISMMICYFFYKNLAFGFTLYCFEAYASFSGQPAYNDWYLACYNVFFTALPVITLGVFDQDVSARLCLQYPLLYQEGVQNALFRWPRILGWMANGILTANIIFFVTTSITMYQAFREDGRVVDYAALGVTMYSCVVWSVNCQMALAINYFTWFQHISIWGSVILWYIFLIVYGFFPSSFSTTAFRAFLETCAPSPLYWITLPPVIIASLLPYIIYRTFQSQFRPMYHDLIQLSRLQSSQPAASGELLLARM